MPRTKSAAKQAKHKLTHAELSAIHKAKWAKIRENMAAKKAAAKEALQDTPAASGLEVFVNDDIVVGDNAFVVYETKTYQDGTVATGVAPLPDKSPAEQEQNTPTPPSQPDVPPQPEQPPVSPESGLFQSVLPDIAPTAKNFDFLKIPEFNSEAEEAEWWDSHQPELLKMFKHAAKDGTMSRGTLKKRGLTMTDPAVLAEKTEEAIERQRAKMTESEKETADKKANAILEKSKKPKKYTGPKEFSVALKAAEARLAKAIVERAQAAGKLSMLQAEIPSLIQIINALKGQQNIPAAPYDLSGSVPNATAFQAPMPTGVMAGFQPAVPQSQEAANFAAIQAAMNAAAAFPVSKAIGSVQLSPEVLGSLDEEDDDIDKYITGSGADNAGWIGG